MQGSSVLVAAVQMTTGPSVADNVQAAEALVARAAGQGAQFVVLPERWNLIDTERRQVAGAEALDGPSTRAVQEWARRHAITVVAGSIAEARPGSDRAFNTSVLVDPDGELVAVYRKLHLFDVEVAGRAYRESDGTVPGERVVSAAIGDHVVGMSICYDLRFPELYRALTRAGADLLVVPAAFTQTTGAAHWEVLLRARAVENQCFVIGAGQVGSHATGALSHGNSMIVDPWGEVLARSDVDGPDVVVAELDFGRLEEIRARLPALRHAREDVIQHDLPR